MLLCLENGMDALEGSEGRDRYILPFGKWILSWLVKLVCEGKLVASELCACIPLNFGFSFSLLQL